MAEPGILTVRNIPDSAIKSRRTTQKHGYFASKATKIDQVDELFRELAGHLPTKSDYQSADDWSSAITKLRIDIAAAQTVQNDKTKADHRRYEEVHRQRQQMEKQNAHIRTQLNRQEIHHHELQAKINEAQHEAQKQDDAYNSRLKIYHANSGKIDKQKAKFDRVDTDRSKLRLYTKMYGVLVEQSSSTQTIQPELNVTNTEHALDSTFNTDTDHRRSVDTAEITNDIIKGVVIRTSAPTQQPNPTTKPSILPFQFDTTQQSPAYITKTIWNMVETVNNSHDSC